METISPFTKLLSSLNQSFQGVLTESLGIDPSDHVFTLVEGTVDTSKNSGNTGNCEELLAGEEEAERSVASVEDQLRKEMTVYEVCYVCE